MKDKNLQPSAGELQNDRENLEQRLALLRQRHTGLRMRYRRIQSEMRLATEGWRPPEWVRRFFERTLSPKLRHSIRQRLITLRNCFEEDWLNLLREQYGKYRRPP